jgi:hypothetical protein
MVSVEEFAKLRKGETFQSMSDGRSKFRAGIEKDIDTFSQMMALLGKGKLEIDKKYRQDLVRLWNLTTLGNLFLLILNSYGLKKKTTFLQAAIRSVDGSKCYSVNVLPTLPLMPYIVVKDYWSGWMRSHSESSSVLVR